MAYRQGLYLHGVERVEVGHPTPSGDQRLTIFVEGGDEFTIMLDFTDASAAIPVIETIVAAPAPAEEVTA